MMRLQDLLNEQLRVVFEKLGYDTKLAEVGLSNKPDLCDFQCNACFVLAKNLHAAPSVVAEKIVQEFNKNPNKCAEASFCNPGFLNFVISDKTLCELAEFMAKDQRAGIGTKQPKTIVLDYGGANVAKPLHVGHLRSAVIGESVKRIARFCGDNVVGDAHLGDWGLQMGLVIAQLMDEIDTSFYFGGKGEKPTLSMNLFNEIYPKASARAKVDKDFAQRAHDATVKLQKKVAGFYDLYQDIRKVSVESVDEEYKRLNVFFDLFYGESDAEPYVKPLLDLLEQKGLTQESQGAIIVDVSKDDDKEPMPPVIVKSSTGSDLYATTDLATILMRKHEFNPDEIWYVTDDRQSLHFKQVFRVSDLCGFTSDGMKLGHYPFGTVNGKDGKPYKTREGGVMKLGDLYALICDKAQEKIKETNRDGDENLARIVGVAALKFGDLINYRAKDYIFDIDKFVSFDGKTGPYILYSAVRIKSILNKCQPTTNCICGKLGTLERNIILECIKFEKSLFAAYDDKAPNYVAQSIYDICQAFSTFYNSTKIITEENQQQKNNYLNILKLVLKILEIGLSLLAIDVPDKM
ncbi:MAG: arginine--tRNA ligase [Christensenellales bacterium]